MAKNVRNTTSIPRGAMPLRRSITVVVFGTIGTTLEHCEGCSRSHTLGQAKSQRSGGRPSQGQSIWPHKSRPKSNRMSLGTAAGPIVTVDGGSSSRKPYIAPLHGLLIRDG